MVTQQTLCRQKTCGPHVAALLNQTPIFERFIQIVKNWHLKDVSYGEIGLRSENISQYKLNGQSNCEQWKKKTLYHNLLAHLKHLRGLFQHLCGASMVGHPPSLGLLLIWIHVF